VSRRDIPRSGLRKEYHPLAGRAFAFAFHPDPAYVLSLHGQICAHWSYTLCDPVKFAAQHYKTVDGRQNKWKINDRPGPGGPDIPD